MSNLIIISEQNFEKLSKAVCEQFKTALLEISSNSHYIVGAWPGGRSLLKFFPDFYKMFSALDNQIIKALHFFQVDERLYTEHNRAILEQNLFSKLVQEKTLDQSQIHYYPLEEANTEDKGVNKYSELLANYGSRFNFAMLGAGGPHICDPEGNVLKFDCHVAGIFAKHPSSDRSYSSPFYHYYDSPKPPPGRVTATYSLLSQTDWSFLFVIGQEKEQVLKEFLNDQANLETTPIKIARFAKNCVLITDMKV